MCDSVQGLRDHIMGKIPGIIHGFVQTIGSSAIRILGDTPNTILDSEAYLESISPFALEVQRCLHDDDANNRTCFVVVKIYRGKHSFFVVDLNNSDYDYQTAHECKTPIPVYVLRLSKRNPRIYRKREIDELVADTVAVMHNGHGHDPLPLFDNHYDEHLQYSNPRSL